MPVSLSLFDKLICVLFSVQFNELNDKLICVLFSVQFNHSVVSDSL